MRILTECLAMMVASALVLMLETVFFHVLVYINNYLEATSVISVALLGLALGGLGGYFIARSGRRRLLPFLAVAVGAATLVSVLNLVYLPQYLTYPVLLVLPFLFASMIIAYLFFELKEHTAYFWNLLGAALGVVLVCLLVPAVFSENTILIAIAASGVLGCLLSATSQKPALPLLLSALVLVGGSVGLGWNLSTGAFDFGKVTRCTHKEGEFHKVFCKTRHRGLQLVYSRDNLVGRVDVLKPPRGAVLNVSQEGVASDAVRRMPPRGYEWDGRIPKALVLPNPRVLVIGASAEGVVKTAKGRSEDTVVGIEINPGIVDLMLNELYEPSGKAYEDIELHVVDARTYLERVDEQFDIITMMNTHTRGRVTENAGVPQYLFTEQAFACMFEHLTERGAVILEEVRINDDSDDSIRRIFASAIAGLRQQGVTDHFERHFYAFATGSGMWNYLIFAITKNPFTPEQAERMDDWFEQKRDRSSAATRRRLRRMMHPEEEMQNDFSRFVGDPQKAIQSALQDEGLDIAAISDNRPFLYDMDTRHPEARRLLVLSAIATAVLILLPSLLLFRRSLAARRLDTWRSVAYFGLIGTAFMLVEIALMQKYQLFLGSPIYALILVLTSILLFSGIGSLTSSRFSSGLKKACILAVPALLLACALGLDSLFEATQSQLFSVRAVIALASLFPLFFCMGVPFPFGLSMARAHLPGEMTALLYGINGAFGTVGVTLSLLLSVYFGFALTFYLGLALYLLAFLLIVGAGGRQPA